MLREQIEEHRGKAPRHRDSAAAAAFGGTDPARGDRAADDNGAAVKVNVLPLQTQHLTSATTCTEEEGQGRVEKSQSKPAVEPLHFEEVNKARRQKYPTEPALLSAAGVNSRLFNETYRQKDLAFSKMDKEDEFSFFKEDLEEDSASDDKALQEMNWEEIQRSHSLEESLDGVFNIFEAVTVDNKKD